MRYGYKASAEQFGARELADFSLRAEALRLDTIAVLELERLADAHPERASSRSIVSADPDDVVERIARYVALGFTELVFHGPGRDQADSWRSSPATCYRVCVRGSADGDWRLRQPLAPALTAMFSPWTI